MGTNKNRESIQEFNFKFSKLIQTITKNLHICTEIIQTSIKLKDYLTCASNFIKTKDYAQKIEEDFLLVEGIQWTEIDSVMSIDAAAGNDLMR